MFKWHRVTDPLSPLFGCDVKCFMVRVPHGYASIVALRRVDIFVGDRPFQLVAPPGETLGLMIDEIQLGDCQLQDETFELATDTPYGKFVNEEENYRDDGCSINVAWFTNATQVAIKNIDGQVVATRTFRNDSHISDANNILVSFVANDEIDDLKFTMGCE